MGMIRIVFDIICFIECEFQLVFKKSKMAAKYGLGRFLKPKGKPKLEQHSQIATYIPFIPVFVSSRYPKQFTELQPFNVKVTWWPHDLDLWSWKVLFLVIVSTCSWGHHLSIMNKEGNVSSRTVASPLTSWASKIHFLGWFITISWYLMSKWNYMKKISIFKMAAILYPCEPLSGNCTKSEV